MRRVATAVGLTAAAACLPGCRPQDADAPPVVRLGDTVCDQCNMIISDERWATATIVEGPRGPEPRLFDDFNCQVNYEAAHPGLGVLARWSHSHATGQWIRTENARFLVSPNLRTPMGSKVAAFGSASEAEAARAERTGDLMTFEIAWARLGFAAAPCHEDDTAAHAAPQEAPDAP